MLSHVLHMVLHSNKSYKHGHTIPGEDAVKDIQTGAESTCQDTRHCNIRDDRRPSM